MENHKPITYLLGRLWLAFSTKRRRQFKLVLGLTIVCSFAEVVSIGALLPFLGALTAPNRIFNTPFFHPIFEGLGLINASQIILPLSILFGVAALFAGAMRLILLWASTRFAFSAGADLSYSIYQQTLYQDYETHSSRNSSEVVNAITSKAHGIIYSAILPVLNLLSSIVMTIAILTTLFLIEPVIALISFTTFGLIYGLIASFSRKQLLIDSARIARNSSSVIKLIQEGLGGIRDILIDGSQQVYFRAYRKADLPLRKAQGNVQFVSQYPRYLMESLGMVLITFLAYFLVERDDGIALAIPILGALALGAQRLLPILQQAYTAVTSIRGGQISLQDAIALLDAPFLNQATSGAVRPIVFEKQFCLNQVSFRYTKNTPLVLKDLTLVIEKGSCVGFMGPTGSGKSTLIDIIMGLIQPTNGSLEIDGVPISSTNNRSWQAHIAHVPQAIFLADSTIQENIAFGVPKEEIDFPRVIKAAEQAEIAVAIEGWPSKYETLVGERGVRLSGGQRQRIGIARALYKNADVIIFDEATSALDNETEKGVMKSIEGLSGNLTILIVAHRLSTLKNCSKIVEIDGGKIKQIIAYSAIDLDGASFENEKK